MVEDETILALEEIVKRIEGIEKRIEETLDATRTSQSQEQPCVGLDSERLGTSALIVSVRPRASSLAG